MENFGIKYLVKSNIIIKVIHWLHYLSYRSDSNSRLVWTWGKAALKFIEGFVWINYHYGRLIWFFNIDSAVLSPYMFPSDLFPQLVNFAEQLFLVPGQGFGYVYFAFGSDTKIEEVTSFFVNKLPSVRIEAIPHIPSRELDYWTTSLTDLTWLLDNIPYMTMDNIPYWSLTAVLVVSCLLSIYYLFS